MLQHTFSKVSAILWKIVFKKITDTFENVCSNIRNVKSNYLKCIASQCLSPPCVLFFLWNFDGRRAYLAEEQESNFHWFMVSGSLKKVREKFDLALAWCWLRQLLHFRFGFNFPFLLHYFLFKIKRHKQQLMSGLTCFARKCGVDAFSPSDLGSLRKMSQRISSFTVF